ncbi:MAG TPA: hypothetical protein PLP84_04070 [Acholeplasmataceae bacterium]|nr:hypothetical protein [Acholeplasmataceae bacterium]
MKKIFNKLSIIILLIFGIFLVSGCEENGDNPPNNGGNHQKEEIVLPTATKQVTTDETIYVIYGQNNEVETIKSAHHFNNAGFFKYELFGNFLQSGHLNITDGQAKVEIKDGKALIPSLKTHDDFFYTLNLNPSHYKSKLPFIFESTYKLNDNKTKLSNLQNATGNVIISYKFTSNPETHVYYKTNYAAQVQVPIDISTATVVDNGGAMASVLVGTTNTLAYMVMPGETKEIIIKLEVKNFKYNGLQAVYQPLDQISQIGSMLDFNDLGLDKLSTLPGGIDQIVAGVNEMNTNVNSLFVGMSDNLETIKTQFSDPQIGLLVNTLLTFNFNSFKNDATYNDGFLEKKQELVSIITPLEALLAQLQTKFNEQTALVTDFNNKYETYSAITNDYELKYLYFLSSIDKLNALKTKVQVLNTVDFTDINAVIENKDLIISNLTEVELLLNEIKEIYTNTINAMYFYPNAFEPIANDMVNLVLKAAEVFGLFVPIKASFEALSAKIGEGIAGNWFNPLTLQGIGMLKGMLDHEDPTGEQPGIIQALGMVVEGTAGMAEQIEGLQSLINMYAFDPEIQMRQIDALYLGFVQINHGLLLKAEGQEASFYDGIYQLTSMKDFVALIPTPLNIDLPSFLSDDNESPLSLQFIVTEK